MTYSDIKILGKSSISLAVGITAYTGYVLQQGRLSFDGLWVFFGILFLSAAASALNQIQERTQDALMHRTQNRPLPSGRVSLSSAWSLVAAFFAAGTLLLSFTTFSGLLWGWLGLVWYNLVYTSLKKITAFSVFPGAVVGAIPPVSGWMAAGGDLGDPRLHFLALFFFLGQMPHFWLLVIKYGEDYRRGGYPTLFDYFSLAQINRINLVWLVATFVGALLLPMNHVLDGRFLTVLLVLSSMGMMGWVTMLFFMQKKERANQSLRKLFIGFNSFYLLVMILISLDQIKW
ncbi:MAG: protoheme IX farnesyltransferase [Breznakibacter sp.]